MEPERHKLGVPARLCLSCPVSLQFGASREFGRRSGPVQPCILLYLKVLGARPFHLPRQCVESCWGARRASSTPASQRGGLAHHWLAPLGAEGEGGGAFSKGHSPQLLSAGRRRARSQSSSGLVAHPRSGRGAQPATCQCDVGSAGLRSINVPHLSAAWHKVCGAEAGRCRSSVYFLSPRGGSTVLRAARWGEALGPRVKALCGSRPGSRDSWNPRPEGCLQT